MTVSDDIQTRLNRLRKAGRLRRRPRSHGPDATPEQPPRPATPSASASGQASGITCLTDLPGMEEVDGTGGRYLLRTVRYPLTHRQGRVSLGELLGLPPEAVARLVDADAFDFRRAVFLDTETSGLAGGAGTIVFLTGVGTFEEDAYVVRQYFARNPAEERAYLPDLAQFVAERGGLVTFNGRSFDWPLLRSRFILSGIRPPDENPHVDLLHPARRLWRPRLGACNFGNLERRILDYQRNGLDIPSWMIPGLWFNFARGEGNAGEMEAVLYHNLEDIVSMAPLAHIIAATLAGVMAPHPQDWLALGRARQRSGDETGAEQAYRRALELPQPPAFRAQALRELALLLKRSQRRAEAAQWWEMLAAMERPNDVEPLVELAKYHEWHTGEIEKARAWTLEAITRAEGISPLVRRREVLAELAHRLERLERKLGNSADSQGS